MFRRFFTPIQALVVFLVVIINMSARSDQTSSALVRRYPPVSFCDTIMGQIGPDGKMEIHGLNEINVPLFSDAEIIRVITPTQPQKLRGLGGRFFNAESTTYGHVVIQQQSRRGCTAAVVAMLIADRGGVIDIQALIETNLGDNKTMMNLASKSGFKLELVYDGRLEIRDLAELSKLVTQYGSLAASIGTELGSHQIVVDYVDLKKRTMTIRDPFHGWQIEVPAAAVLETRSLSDLMRIRKP
ncbi:MAG: hypothetical protein IT289_13400 [Oligoflexia bacterium]|nr:hypothetical protein [Oligoflexia bacterium]